GLLYDGPRGHAEESSQAHVAGGELPQVAARVPELDVLGRLRQLGRLAPPALFPFHRLSRVRGDPGEERLQLGCLDGRRLRRPRTRLAEPGLLPERPAL